MTTLSRNFPSTPRLVALTLASLVWMSGVACDSIAQTRLEATSEPVESGLWISPDSIRALPMKGAAWEALRDAARRPVRNPNLSNQNDPSNVLVFAKALYFVRTGDPDARVEVLDALQRIRGSDRGATSLAISRELMAYVLAADLIGLSDAERADFSTWLRSVRDRSYRDRTIRSTHENRPNNWGTHAGATRIAVAAYLGDQAEIERAAYVFRSWTGDPPGWPGFAFGDPDWQASPTHAYAVNPVGALRDGHPIGGVLPDDQRRGGPFRWPPPKENYVYEALQGAVAQALLLERLGYDSWNWGDRALSRAFTWLHDEADFPAEGDDTWIPHLVNRAYGTSFPAPIPSSPGKAIGFTDWTHATADAPRPIAAPSGPSAANPVAR